MEELKLLVKELVKLQVLCSRWVERNTNLRCDSIGHLESILMGNKYTCTYLFAVESLKKNINKYCKNSYLEEKVSELENKISSSKIKNLRFGISPQSKFTEEENTLNLYRVQRIMYMLNGMVEIKKVTEILGLTESQVKQACQQERLMNTRKVGKTWLVHIQECRAYWNIKDNEDNLYSSWEY